MRIRNFFIRYKLVISLSLLIISFSFFFMFFINIEPDYYWHLKAGDYMRTHGEILTHDIFSWITMGRYWMSHEWLFEILLSGLKSFFGEFHIFIYCFFMVVGIGLFLFFSNLKAYLKNIPFSLLWISFSALIFSTVSCRPHLISYLLLAISIYVLQDLFYNPQSKKIYVLPAISLLWANIHGGSSNLPYLLCLIFVFCGLFQFKFAKMEASRISKKQIFTYLGVMFFCILATCINPHGPKLLLYPYQNMADGLMLSTISEWQPTNLNMLPHYGYLVFVALIVFIFIYSHKKIRFLDFILFIFVLFLGLKSIRFWFYAYIVGSFFIFYYVRARKVDKLTVPLIIIISVAGFILFVQEFRYPPFESNKVSSSAIKVLKRENPKRLYNDYNYGGSLVYEGILVFIDGRADLYSSYNYKDYQDISNLSYNFTKLIFDYNFDYFITAKKSGLATYLDDNSSYQRIFRDKNTVIYKKKTT